MSQSAGIRGGRRGGIRGHGQGRHRAGRAVDGVRHHDAQLLLVVQRRVDRRDGVGGVGGTRDGVEGGAAIGRCLPLIRERLGTADRDGKHHRSILVRRDVGREPHRSGVAGLAARIQPRSARSRKDRWNCPRRRCQCTGSRALAPRGHPALRWSSHSPAGPWLIQIPPASLAHICPAFRSARI